jgi:hypothetical protein
MSQTKKETKVPGIYVKLEWGPLVQKLSDKDAGRLLKNMLRFPSGEELIPMSGYLLGLWEVGISAVLKFNEEKYIKKTEANRENGKLGGRPIGNKNSSSPKSQENRKNPLGYLGSKNNPENPKDIYRDKVIDRDKEKAIDRKIDTDKEREKVNNRIDNKTIETSIGSDVLFCPVDYGNSENQRESYIQKFAQFDMLESNQIHALEAQDFYYAIKELTDKIGWPKFFKLILDTPKNEIESQLSVLGIVDQLHNIKEVQRNFEYYLGKI